MSNNRLSQLNPSTPPEGIGATGPGNRKIEQALEVIENVIKELQETLDGKSNKRDDAYGQRYVRGLIEQLNQLGSVKGVDKTAK
jgi:50S ribosomal subunit-associated GTPase HflX